MREMTLPVEELIRRFLLHVLPQGLVRIRYYGLLSNRHRQRNLALCRELLGVEAVVEGATDPEEDWQGRLLRLTGCDPTLCSVCGKGRLRRIEELAPSAEPPRPPP